MPTDLMPLHSIASKYRKSPETIRLWITRGILVNGERVRLAARKLGGSWAVSETELLAWFDETYTMSPGVESISLREAS